MLPNDPFMLLSFVNTMLRDRYASLDDFCISEGVDRALLERKLEAAGFEYVEGANQFK